MPGPWQAHLCDLFVLMDSHLHRMERGKTGSQDGRRERARGSPPQRNDSGSAQRYPTSNQGSFFSHTSASMTGRADFVVILQTGKLSPRKVQCLPKATAWLTSVPGSGPVLFTGHMLPVGGREGLPEPLTSRSPRTQRRARRAASPAHLHHSHFQGPHGIISAAVMLATPPDLASLHL